LLFNVGTFLSGRRTPIIGVGLAVVVGLAWWSTQMGYHRALVRIWAPMVVVAIVGAILLEPSGRRLIDLTVLEYGPSLEPAAEIFADEPRAEVIAPVRPRIALYTASAAIARDSFPMGWVLGRVGSHLSR